MLKKILLVLLSLVLLLAIGVTGGGYWFFHHALAVTSGDLKTGVQAPVKIERDSYGIPHIYAQNEHDLMYAQGYVEAQDRMFQMELSRRAVSGTLSEVMGASMLPTDKLFLTIGLKRSAEEAWAKIDPQTKQDLQDFSDGVNGFLKESTMPVEFTALSIKPQPWTPVDSLAIAKYMAWDLGGNMRSELFLSTVSNKVGQDKAMSLVADLLPTTTTKTVADKTAQVPPSMQQPVETINPKAVDQILSAMGAGKELGIPGVSLGSNNWVLAGSRSESGKPLMGSDMHLGMGAPSIFYQNHLVVPGQLDVTGVIFPGVPGVIVGHNDKISWSFTNVGADVEDLYIEKRNPNNPNQFEYNGKYEDAKVIHESVKVKGQAKPETFDVQITRHGPIITDVADKEVRPKDPLAMRWTAYEFNDEITALLAFDHAKNWTEFEKAARSFCAPGQNIVFADTDGNIAYRANGKFPIRKKGDGMLPVPGWTDEYEWAGYIPWEELPFQMNPTSGFIATANNKITPDGYKYSISHEWSQPYRINRIDEMIEEKPKHTLDDMIKMQLDWKNLQAQKMVPLWVPILEKANLSAEEKKALEEMKAWAKNPINDPNEIGPTIYESTYNKTLEHVYLKPLGDELFNQLVTTGISTVALDSMFLQHNTKFLDGGQADLEQALVAGFKDGYAFNKQKLGDNMQNWQWGKIHTITFEHPLGSVQPLDKLYNDGPYPYGGSQVTVNEAAYSLRMRPYKIHWSAPWRYVIDMNDPSKAKDIMEMGASDQLGSKHYKDQTPMWLSGTYKDMYFTQGDVDKHTEDTLVLDPK